MPMPKWEGVLIHHSAGPDDDDMQYDDMRDYHVGVKGWMDLGYHKVVEQLEGSCVTISGRPMWREGAHCPGMNRKRLGIVNVGNFMAAPPDTDKLMETARTIVELILMFQWGEDMDRIIQAHRDHKSTRCPGDKYPMAELRKLTAAALKLAK